MAKKTKEKNNSHLINLGVGIAVVVLLIILGIFYQGGAGEAVYIGDQPYLDGPADLEKEETLVFQVLPEEEKVIEIITPLVLGEAPLAYTFTLSKVDELTYSYSITQNNQLIAEDVLYIGGIEDSTLVYLNEEDAHPDLEISYQNNHIIVTNLHFASAASAVVTLTDTNGTAYNQIIFLNTSQSFTAFINGTSELVPPSIDVNVGETSELSLDQKTLLSTFTIQAPAEPTAVLLDIVATVGGQETHAYYILAVGGVVYQLQEEGFPQMTINMSGPQNGLLNVTFAQSGELQPFALPCEIAGLPPGVNPEGDTTFSPQYDNVERIYSYSGQHQLPSAWSRDAPVGDLKSFRLFEGYFIEMVPGVEPKISLDCTFKSLKPITSSSQEGERKRITLAPGWNLFSLPGLIPQPLADFITPNDSLRMYSCTTPNQCTSITVNQPLVPGQPYWIYTEEALIISYIEE